MTVTSFLPMESRVVLLISLPHLLRPIRTIGRVIWIREQRFNAVYECGVEFLEVSPEDRKAIAEMVEQGTIFSR